MPLRHAVHEISLKNGAKGLIIDVPGTTTVSYEIHFRAGNDYVAKRDRQQAAHLMEHLSFGANRLYPNQEAFSQEFTKNGATYNATTWDRGMAYHADAPLLEWDRILDLLQIAITEPVYTQAALDAEKGNVREELVGYANNHSRVLWQRLYREMGEDFTADPEKLMTVDAVTLADIRHHHKTTHTTRNMRFIIAGNLSKHHDRIIEALESWPLPQGERLPASRQLLHSAPPLTIQRKELSNARFSFSSVLNRELSDAEIDAMGALNHILTGTFHSRIWGRARTLGICYGMGSSTYTDIEGVSRWEMYGQVSMENAPALFALMTEQLQKVAAGDLTEEELDNAKLYALGYYQMRAQTVREITNWYFDDYFDKDKVSHVKDTPKMIRQTRRSTMTTLAKEFLDAGIWTLGVIGNMPAAETKRLHKQMSVLFPAQK